MVGKKTSAHSIQWAQDPKVSFPYYWSDNRQFCIRKMSVRAWGIYAVSPHAEDDLFYLGDRPTLRDAKKFASEIDHAPDACTAIRVAILENPFVMEKVKPEIIARFEKCFSKEEHMDRNTMVVESWADIKKKYPMDRDEMTPEEEALFVADCFTLYEKEGFSPVFWSPFAECTEKVGLPVEIIGRVEADSVHDLTCLPMWRARLDGREIEVYPEEVVPSEMKENGCRWFANILMYDGQSAAGMRGLDVDVMSPQECADAFGRAVQDGTQFYLPKNVRSTVYCGYECGVLLPKEHPEYAYYAVNNPVLPYGFYDEDQGFIGTDQLKETIDKMREYVAQGVDMTYAVVSVQGKCSLASLSEILERDSSERMSYSYFRNQDEVVFSLCKIDGKLNEDFLENLIDAAYSKSKPSLDSQIQSASVRSSIDSGSDFSKGDDREQDH